MNQIYIIITLISIVVICVCALLTFTPVNELLKRKLSETSYTTLNEIAETATSWAEQWLTGRTGTEKKNEVVLYVVNKCDSLGLDVTAEDIDKAIEAAVKKLK